MEDITFVNPLNPMKDTCLTFVSPFESNGDITIVNPVNSFKEKSLSSLLNPMEDITFVSPFESNGGYNLCQPFESNERYRRKVHTTHTFFTPTTHEIRGMRVV